MQQTSALVRITGSREWNNGPNRVGVSNPLTLGQKQIQLLKLYLYQMMEKALKPM
jgi:hypothetical protein